MKTIAMVVGILALAGTIVPAALFFFESLWGPLFGPLFGAEMTVSLTVVKTVMLVSAIAWFVAAPFWMKVN